jgi:hypothetical protein
MYSQHFNFSFRLKYLSMESVKTVYLMVSFKTSIFVVCVCLYIIKCAALIFCS